MPEPIGAPQSPDTKPQPITPDSNQVQSKPPATEPKPEPKSETKPRQVSQNDIAALLPDEMKDVAGKANDKGIISLPYDAFIERMNRMQRSQLKKLFGTDNIQEILKLKTEHEAMKKEREEAEKARMTEIERERKAAADAKLEVENWQKKYNQLHRKTTANEAGNMIKAVAAKHINMAYARHVLSDLARDLTSNYTEAQLAKFTEKHIDHWFKKYLQKNPIYAASPVTPAPATGQTKPVAKKVVKKVPASNGPGNARPTPPAANANTNLVNGKDPRPGKANSMTRAEFEAYKKSLGLNV